MKKLVLFFAVIVAVSFASCGNKKAAPAEESPAVEQAAPATSYSIAKNDSVATAATAATAAPAAAATATPAAK